MKRKNRKGHLNKTLIAFLFMLSIVLTTSTFAYWATSVEGTEDDAVGTLSIGSAESVDTKFVISNELNTGGLLIPKGQLNNSEINAVESIDLSFDVKWEEDEDISQLAGTTSVGIVRISHELEIEHNGEVLDLDKYSVIYDLITVAYNPNNPETLILDENAKTYNFTVTLDEPKNQEQYNLISESTISVVFSYLIIDNNVTTSKEVTGAYVSLNGEDTVIVEVSEKYKDEGATAYNSLGEEIKSVWTTGSANFWEVGTYTITYQSYSSYDNSFAEEATRTIIVVDTTAPVITMNGPDTFDVKIGSNYSDWGAWASDNSGSTVTMTTIGLDEIDTSVVGTYYVTYTAIDQSGNESSVIRTINVK